MISVISLLVVLTLSILITRIATVALVHTGMSREAARFQARSAFTGVGFTTSEAEQVVNHPVRRRIILLLMLLGNAGIVSAISSLMLTFVNVNTGMPLWARIGVLLTGIAVLWALATSSVVDRWLSLWISWALERWTDLDVRDYEALLQLQGEYEIVEMLVEPDDWWANKSLAELRLQDEGVLVLGIQRADGRYVGAPRGDTVIEPGDELLLYGRETVLHDLDCRKKGRPGDRAHARMVALQKEVMRKESLGDRIITELEKLERELEELEHEVVEMEEEPVPDKVQDGAGEG